MSKKGTGFAAGSGADCTGLVQFRARLDDVPEAQAYVATALQLAELTPFAVARAELLLEELFRNVILHGYGGECDRPVWVGVEGGSFCIEDEAPPFNPLTDGAPSAAPDPALPVEQLPVGGVGLLLIRQMGSSASYLYLDGRNRMRIAVAA